jgi:lipopolysaccharide heptosyltransferase II
MDALLYWLGRGLVALIQALPLPIVARLGRAGGALTWWLDARHRRVTLRNLEGCFAGEKSAAEIRQLGREVFRRLGENYASAVKTAAMTDAEVARVVEVTGVDRVLPDPTIQPPPSRVVAIGHFGNFELYARLAGLAPGYRFATTYRALRQAGINRLMQELRNRSDCVYFERRTESAALRTAMSEGGMMLGLLADQHAGSRGVWAPFLGRMCSTTAAPAVLALRYNSPLFTAICYRVALGRWRVEVGQEIPTRESGRPRPPEAITRDLIQALESAVRRDPANWFWVHDRWKPGGSAPPSQPSEAVAQDEPAIELAADAPAAAAPRVIAGGPEPKRIVVRGVNWLGDAVMSIPALIRLREAFPNAEITLLVGEKLADLFQSHPALDRVLAFRANESVWQIGKRLKSGAFDMGVALPNSPRSALELWLGGVPRRVGIARPWRRAFLTHAISPAPAETPMRKLSAATIRRYLRQPPAGRHFQAQPGAHQVHQYLHLVAALGASSEPLAPTIPVAAAEVEAARVKFGLGPEPRGWLALNAGAAYGSAKRWPVERFIETAIELQRHGHGRWMILGGLGDIELANRIADGIRRGLPPVGPDGKPFGQPLRLAGRMTLRELAAVLTLGKVLLTNDTGPMHLAAAVGTPVVAPFGSTSPELTGPGLPGTGCHRLLRSSVPCAPCFRRDCPIDLRCMRTIPVLNAVRALEAILDETASAGHPSERSGER